MTIPSTDRSDKHDREKPLPVIVNGREKQVTGKELTYDQIVRLAYEQPPTGPDVLFTITYRRGEGDKPEGSLTPGASVRVKEGMVFNVAHTDKS